MEDKKYSALFSSRLAANEAALALAQVVRDYGQCCVAYFKEIVGMSSDYSDMDYGWTNLDEMCIEPCTAGDAVCRLVMPKVRRLKPLDTPTSNNNDDMVSHPKHYISETGLEVIDVIEAFTFNLNGIEATDTGNIIKYICRWKEKGGVQDLKKLVWYAEHLINHLENLEKENNE